ncbi:MAG: hypothetical protein ACP5LD_15145, partial [Desulfomonilaceae bacterium]
MSWVVALAYCIMPRVSEASEFDENARSGSFPIARLQRGRVMQPRATLVEPYGTTDRHVRSHIPGLHPRLSSCA